MVLIHEKIIALLEQRRLKRRDLARALGVSPQTATDICKGRSAITLPHLRNLIALFEVRADFWLDDGRLVPDEVDQHLDRRVLRAVIRSGLSAVADPEQFLLRLRLFAQRHRTEFLAAFPDLSADERRVLGIGEPGSGFAGQISG